MRYLYLAASLVLLLPLSGYSQERGPSSTKGSTDIRHIDFKNYTYYPSTCDRDYHVGSTVQVTDGEFTAGTVNQGANFHINRVVYGDLTGDGREEALVYASCEPVPNNNAFGNEFFVYSLQNGRVVMLGEINDERMGRDYRRYYPYNSNSFNGVLWNIVPGGNEVTIVGKVIKIEVYADGAHCCPKHIVVLEYRWAGRNLVLTRKPQRRALKS